MTGLILPKIVNNVKKKLGCIFVENHNSETLELKRGQTIGLVTSCVVTQEELGQQPEKCKEDTSASQYGYDVETHIGGARGGNEEKTGRKEDSVQSLENKRCYET